MVIPRHWRRHGLLRRASIGTLALVSFIGIATTAATAQRISPAKKLSPTQLGLNFYKGKTITYVIPAAPGGGYYAFGSTITPFLAQYLGATVNDEVIPQGSTLPGQDAAAAAHPDGLTIGEIGISADVSVIFTGIPGLNFNPLRESFLGSGGTTPSAYLVAPGGPFKTWKAAENGAQFSECLPPTGAQIQNSAILYPAFGLHGKILDGYANTSAIVQGFIRGDCAVTDVPLSTAGPLIQGGQAIPILLTAKPAKGELYSSLVQGVPTIAKQLAATPPKTSKAQRAVQALVNIDGGNSYEVFTGTKVPVDEVLALRAAVEWALKNPQFIAKAQGLGLATGYHSGFQDKLTFQDDLKNEPLVVSYLHGAGA